MTRDPEPFDAEMFVAGHGWPLDGPYSPERLRDALNTAAELIRYANHAVLAGPRSSALRSPPELYPTLGALSTTAVRLGELANRLAEYLSVHVPADPALRHDQYSAEPPAVSKQAAAEASDAAAVKLWSARKLANAMARTLDEAHSEVGHLYHDEQ